jgi:small multidrug resistance pump/quaternary ammonium compound-resistance protein SugE
VSLSLLVAASVAYAVGGVFMKLSRGVTQPGPTIAVLLLFSAGALLQARAMRDAEMGVSYVIVLGLEAALAVLLSAFVLGESLSSSRLAAMAVVIAGVAWLRVA